MASAHFSACARANLRPLLFPPTRRSGSRRARCPTSSGFRVSSSSSSSSSKSSSSSSNGDPYSYLDMWKKAVERERKSQEFSWIAEKSSGDSTGSEEGDGGGEDDRDSLGRKTDQFKKILEIPREERDRIQRLQIIDRAAAAIAATRALVREPPQPKLPTAAARSGSDGLDRPAGIGSDGGATQQGLQGGNSFDSEPGTLAHGTPGPDFWSWSPPDSGSNLRDVNTLQPASKSNLHPNSSITLIEIDNSVDYLPIPFQSTLSQSKHNPPLPPLQSLVQIEKVDTLGSTLELPSSVDEHNVDELSSRNATEAAEALGKSGEASSHGANPDGSKWWKETGVEQRPDGVICKWTLTRGVSADEAVEWEDKFWEASDQFDHKELGSEKSGRDAAGNVWHEYWKESMWQDLRSGLVHIEKTADKWGKNGKCDEWHEKWWEHYDASGQSEKWAHKWCSIDPNTPLDAGHAHVWHERWGEKYDGEGGSIKYTDKWAERSVGDGWAKWGDKWDENFNSYGHGVKQGETWWAGEHGDQWNRTWGEHHNGSGWVHKYGKSSSGEHWDTHVEQETWYERYPHYGFDHCFENSVQLRAVRKPPETS